MTPDIETLLKACLGDVQWFIDIFDVRAAAAGGERFQVPLGRLRDLQRRLELLGNAVRADAAGQLSGEVRALVETLGRVESGIESAGQGVSELRSQLGTGTLDQVLGVLIEAAGTSTVATPSAAPAKKTPAKKAAQPKARAAGDAPATVDLPVPQSKEPSEFSFNRYHVDLSTQNVTHEKVQCQDLEDVFGGIARSFKMLQDCPVDDAYAPEAKLILNLGILSGTDFMTGLRTFFHGYSPLKSSNSGKPGSMWSAGSCKFGTKLRHLDIAEIVFSGRAPNPTLLRLAPASEGKAVHPGGPSFHFLDATKLLGKTCNGKIQDLHRQYPDAHFAVIGPAGENYEAVRYAAIALSTQNQLKSGDAKSRWCGRGGFGGVMGSKNLIGMIADGPDRKDGRTPPELKELNKKVARGDGSRRFRDKKKGNGGGGTWANYEALNPIHSMPEMNFVPTGTEVSFPLHRENVEAMDGFTVKDEACYRCGIRCHKNVYETDEKGKAKKYRAKLDFEPLNLLASNIGIFDIDHACELVELVDEMGMDSISCGVSLSYVMEYNKRAIAAGGPPIAGGLSFGDYEGTKAAILALGAGELSDVGQGSKRLSEKLGETSFAMHCKGVEFPAYLPQTNPGYPWALAGGHMSMKTYLLLVYEKETGIDYWVDAITNRGPAIMRDDMLGICKFAGMPDEDMVTAITHMTGLKLCAQDLKDTVMRTYMRGYAMERAQGFEPSDYVMPALAHEEFPQIELPYFNSPEFFSELQGKVLEAFDQRLALTLG